MVAELPSAWNELVRLAETKLGFVPLRFFLATGDELDEDGLDLVRSNEVIYVSGGGADSPSTEATSDATSEALATLHSPPEQRHRTVIALANLSHHLQRERGTSCTWLASGRSKPSFRTLLVDIRPEVDTALREVARPEAQQWFDKIVALIAAERHAVDAAPASVAGRTGARPPLPSSPARGGPRQTCRDAPHPPPPPPSQVRQTPPCDAAVLLVISSVLDRRPRWSRASSCTVSRHPRAVQQLQGIAGTHST